MRINPGRPGSRLQSGKPGRSAARITWRFPVAAVARNFVWHPNQKSGLIGKLPLRSRHEVSIVANNENACGAIKLKNIKLREQHINFLRENKIFLHPSGRYDEVWLKTGRAYNTHYQSAHMERYSSQTAGPALSSLGAFSYSAASLGPNASIGRYCAIGAETRIMKASHPYEWIGMCGFDYSNTEPYGSYMREHGYEEAVRELPEDKQASKVVIGNGVWIALNVLLKRQISIGEGAVVASNSVVTRDVPPYALVAGNPAQVKRLRFSEKIVERMLGSGWHRYAFTDFRTMDTSNPEKFLDQL